MKEIRRTFFFCGLDAFFVGSVFVPDRYSSRIAFVHVMLFSVLILNYYSASVVSDRLKNIDEKMGDSLIDLANSNLKVAAESTPYIRSFLQVYTITEYCVHILLTYFT